MDDGNSQQDETNGRFVPSPSRPPRQRREKNEISSPTSDTAAGAQGNHSQSMKTKSSTKCSDNVNSNSSNVQPITTKSRNGSGSATTVNRRSDCQNQTTNIPGHNSTQTQRRSLDQKEAKDNSRNCVNTATERRGRLLVEKEFSSLNLAQEELSHLTGLTGSGHNPKLSARPKTTSAVAAAMTGNPPKQSARPEIPSVSAMARNTIKQSVKPKTPSTTDMTGNTPNQSTRPKNASTATASTSSLPKCPNCDKMIYNPGKSNQKKGGPQPPTFSKASPRRQTMNVNTQKNPRRVTKSEEIPQIPPLTNSAAEPQPQAKVPETQPPAPASASASTRQSYPPIGLPPGFTPEQAEDMLKKFIPETKLTRTSPDGSLTSATVKVHPACPPSAASRINQQCREEHAHRRNRLERRMSNKIGKSFQALEETLPAQFMPQERTRKAILEQTRNFTKMLENQLAAAPATSMCLVCNKPRIACGCEVPEFLRQPVQRVGQRMDDYIAKQFEADDAERTKFRIRVYEEEITSDEEEDGKEEEGEEVVVVEREEAGGGDEGDEKKEEANSKEMEPPVVGKEMKKKNGGNHNGKNKSRRKRGKR